LLLKCEENIRNHRTINGGT